MVDDDNGLWVVLLGGSGLFHWLAMDYGLWVVVGGGSGLRRWLVLVVDCGG